MSTVDERLSYVERQIVSMDKDIDGASKLSAKFDQSLDKMSEAVSSIQQLLAVHDSTIRRHHETDLDIYRAMGEAKKDNIENKRVIMTEIEKSHKLIGEKIDKLDDDISDKLGEIATTMSDHDRRIRGLERITFIGLGLAMLIGLLVDKIPFDKIF